MRLGAPERLEFRANTCTNREAMVLVKLGYPTPRQWYRALVPRRVKLEPIEDEWPLVVDVELDITAWTAAVWMALRRVGIVVDIDTLEFDFESFSYGGDDDEVEEPRPKGGETTESTTTSGE